MKSECEEPREPERRPEPEPPAAPPLPPIVPAQPLRGESEDNLDRREDYFRKRHGRS